MYADPATVPEGTLFQGDIITNFPFFIYENGLPLQRSGEEGFVLDPGESNAERRLHAIESKRQQVMILSQSCDVQRRTNIIICPVYDLQSFIADNTINVGTAGNIRARKVNYLFYLPTFRALSESIVDFQTMTYVPKTELDKYLPNRTTTLSDLGRHHLAWSLATYFGRPAEE